MRGAMILLISRYSFGFAIWQTMKNTAHPVNNWMGNIIQYDMGIYLKKKIDNATIKAIPYEGATSFICIQEL